MSISHNDLRAMFNRSHKPRRTIGFYGWMELAAYVVFLTGWAFCIASHWSR